jgi:hypothetical protein
VAKIQSNAPDMQLHLAIGRFNWLTKEIGALQLRRSDGLSHVLIGYVAV